MNNVFSVLQESYKKYPNRVYVVEEGREWTYYEIFNKVIALTKYMNNYSISPGDRIIIYLDNSVQYVVAYFSVLLKNAIVVPINKNTTIENLKYIIEDSSPKLILSNQMSLKRIQNCVGIDECCTINIDLLNEENLEKELPNINSIILDSELPAMILYTSGTTKLPKGVTLSHKNLIANTESILEYLELTYEDSILATINFSYSYGNSLLLTHTKIGGRIIIENRVLYPQKVIEQIYDSKTTGFSTVGSYLNLLLKQDGLKPLYMKNLKYITLAGEGTAQEDIFKLSNIAPHLKIIVMYGQTEAAARLSYLEASLVFKRMGSIGKGIPGVTLRVVIEDGRDVMPGEIGEIIATGKNIMKGYWNNQEGTEEVIKNGWLHTGDLATVDEDGYIYVKGRNDDLIKYLGHRISPMEIEGVINSSEQVLESAVVAVENEHGKQIKAFIIPKYNNYDKDTIIAFIKKRLPAFKRPHIIEFVDEIPRTVNGKIKRNELRNTREEKRLGQVVT